tara:strand:- start:1032 stop:1598 length:567 start_codon:yes stop_codon:yes gene_type:complete
MEYFKNKKIFFLIVLIGIISLLYESQNSILKGRLNSNEILLEKFKEFKKNGFENEMKFSKDLIESIIDSAKSYEGTPNKIGGISKDSIDASGLVYMSIKKNSDKYFPRIAQDMSRYGKVITQIKDLKRGDLVFFFNTYETDRLITSVGIYLGENKFINSSSKNGVSISEITDPFFWKDKFFFGTRIFK